MMLPWVEEIDLIVNGESALAEHPSSIVILLISLFNVSISKIPFQKCYLNKTIFNSDCFCATKFFSSVDNIIPLYPVKKVSAILNCLLSVCRGWNKCSSWIF